jgi:hypothetical protein
LDQTNTYSFLQENERESKGMANSWNLIQHKVDFFVHKKEGTFNYAVIGCILEDGAFIYPNIYL